MHIILFEDDKIENLYPITLTRAGFEIGCGGINLYNLTQKYFKGKKISFIVRDYLAKVVTERHRVEKLKGNNFLFINARVVPSVKNMLEISKILKKTGVVLENEGSFFGRELTGGRCFCYNSIHGEL